MSHNENITRIKAVYNALGDLKNKVVFVGGATVSLYADRQATEVRPTDDVDILIEISSNWEFANLDQQLRIGVLKMMQRQNLLGDTHYQV